MIEETQKDESLTPNKLKQTNGTDFNLKTTVSPVFTTQELAKEHLQVTKMAAIEEPDMRTILGFLN